MSTSRTLAVCLAVALAGCGASVAPPTSSGDDGAALDAIPLMDVPEASSRAPAAPVPRAPRPRTHRDPICVDSAPKPTPRAGHLNGDIARSAIQQPIRARVGAVRDCYERALARDPILQGRVAIQFTVDPDGAVRRACEARDESAEDGLDDPALITCIAEVFTTMQFSAPPRTLRVTYPFELRPEE